MMIMFRAILIAVLVVGWDVCISEAAEQGLPHVNPAHENSASTLNRLPHASPDNMLSEINPVARVSFSSLSATRARPIFSPSRRPPPVKKPMGSGPNGSQVLSRPHLTLLGVIAGSERKMAVFLDGKSQAVVRMKIGESHLGWRLQSVEWREATLVSGQQVINFSIPTN